MGFNVRSISLGVCGKFLGVWGSCVGCENLWSISLGACGKFRGAWGSQVGCEACEGILGGWGLLGSKLGSISLVRSISLGTCGKFCGGWGLRVGCGVGCRDLVDHAVDVGLNLAGYVGIGMVEVCGR